MMLTRRRLVTAGSLGLLTGCAAKGPRSALVGTTLINGTGDLADLLVLPGDPLHDFSVINRVERVMRRGAWKEIS
jgi:hypothetical protein